MTPFSLVAGVSGFLALCGVRWAYVTYVAAGLLYFPLRTGFQLNPHACRLAPDLPRALQTYPHIALFALFFVLTSRQIQMNRWSAFASAGLATVAMGASVELAEALTRGNCQLSDLIADCYGALLGMVLVFTSQRLKSAVVPIGKNWLCLLRGGA